MKVVGAITVGIAWARDKNVDRSNFLVDLGKHRYINRIPGYHEMLVVTFVLPDLSGASLVCTIKRGDD